VRFTEKRSAAALRGRRVRERLVSRQRGGVAYGLLDGGPELREALAQPLVADEERSIPLVECLAAQSRVPDLSALPPIAGAVDTSDFVAKRLYDRRFVVVSSPQRPRGRLDLRAFASADQLVVGPDADGRGFVDDCLAKLGLRRRVAATVTSFHTAAHVVARTHLVCTLLEEVAHSADVALVIAKPPLALPLLPMQLL